MSTLHDLSYRDYIARFEKHSPAKCPCRKGNHLIEARIPIYGRRSGQTIEACVHCGWEKEMIDRGEIEVKACRGCL